MAKHKVVRALLFRSLFKARSSKREFNLFSYYKSLISNQNYFRSKIQNYVTITNLNDKQIHSFRNKKVNLKPNEECPSKKISSYNMPARRSYDFERFALINISNFSDEQIKDSRGSQQNHPSLSLHSYPSTSADDSASGAYTDDEKLYSTHHIANCNDITRSFPEFQRGQI